MQWDTFCKNMSTITNISQVGVVGLENYVVHMRGRGCGSQICCVPPVLVLPLYDWYPQVGGTSFKPDKELSIKVLHAADKILEEQRASAWNLSQKK
jgi:hypothetical protein